MDREHRQLLEAELEDAFRRGDLHRTASRLVAGYGPEILGLLVATLRDQHRAAEVFSQLCEDLWRGLPSFRGQSSFRTWAYALAHHAAHRWRRDPYQRRAAPLAAHPEIEEIAARVRTTTLTYLRSDVKDRVRGLRDQLTYDEQTLLVLRVDRDMSWEEIAEIVHGPAQDERERARQSAGLRKRFERTKSRLRALVERDRDLSSVP